MNNQKETSIVYDADGIKFTIYATTKPTKSGPKAYWALVDRSTGKRRLLNNKTLRGAKERAHKIRAAMVKGQASRMALTRQEFWPHGMRGLSGFPIDSGDARRIKVDD